MTVALTKADLAIIRQLQLNPRIPMTELAEVTASSASACWRRIKRLEEEGVISGYSVTLDRRALGMPIDAFAFVKLTSHGDQPSREFEEALNDIEEIIACYVLSGSEDFMLRIIATDLDSYNVFCRKILASLPHIKEIRTAFVMQTLKESSELPLKFSLQNVAT